MNVTTTVPDEMYKEIKKRGIPFNTLIKIGFRHIAEGNEDNDREQDEKIARLVERLSQMSAKYYEVQDRLETLESKRRQGVL